MEHVVDWDNGVDFDHDESMARLEAEIKAAREFLTSGLSEDDLFLN